MRSLATSAAVVAAVALGVAAVSLAGACSVGDIDPEGRGCPCTTGYVCDTARDLCVHAEVALQDAAAFFDASIPCRGPGCACTDDASCGDTKYPKCVAGKCVECVTSPDSCPVGSYCLPTNECAPGCKASSECATLSPTAPLCNATRHQCVECATSADCKDNKLCSPGGACTTSCANEGQPCATPGTTCCGGFCIDTKNDPLNCNGCGAACTGAKGLCCGGSCTDPLTNVQHCGRCGSPCDSTVNTVAGTSCSAGACKFTCATGFGHCVTGNTGCETATATTTTSCGSCNLNCNTTVQNATSIGCAASACTFTCKAYFADGDRVASNGCEVPCGAGGQRCCAQDVCQVGKQCETDGKCH